MNGHAFLFFLHFSVKIGGYNYFIAVCRIISVDTPIYPLQDWKNIDLLFKSCELVQAVIITRFSKTCRYILSFFNLIQVYNFMKKCKH